MEALVEVAVVVDLVQNATTERTSRTLLGATTNTNATTMILLLYRKRIGKSFGRSSERIYPTAFVLQARKRKSNQIRLWKPLILRPDTLSLFNED